MICFCFKQSAFWGAFYYCSRRKKLDIDELEYKEGGSDENGNCICVNTSWKHKEGG